jgi:type IV secretory pathway TraG/TraD family ATPase VirD4
MRARLGALLHGEYGAILEAGAGRQLDLLAALDAPGITYVSLPALAVSEDTALMARVLIQDLKQAAYERLRQADANPALLILDEFAALGDPEQIQDLLRQAREARVGVVISTQQLPDARWARALRQTLLGAGLLVAHRLGADDAEAVARVIGSVRGARVTRSYEHGEEVGRRSVTTVDRYAVEPDALQRLAIGEAMVVSATGTARQVRRIFVVRPGTEGS